MQVSIFFVFASLGFLVGTHGKIIPETEPQFNVFAVLPFIISRHCSLMNKSESTKEIQEIVRQKTEPLLDLSRPLLIKSFGISHTDQESEMFKETLSKYCKNEHSSWGKNTEEWMAAVKPCFQDNIYNKIIEDQDRINASLKALCDHQFDGRVEDLDFARDGGATDPEHMYAYTIYSPVYIYSSCYIRKGIKSTDQIIETVFEKFRPLWELKNAFNTMDRHSSNLTDASIESFLSSLQKYCVKYVDTVRSDLKAGFQAASPCYKDRENVSTMVFNRMGWTVEYACQHQDQVEGFLRSGGLECGHKTNEDWYVCANFTRFDQSNPCETLRSYSKITECANRSLQNCPNSGGAELSNYMHQEVSKMLPCNITLFP